MSGADKAIIRVVINLKEGHHTGIYPYAVYDYAGVMLTEDNLVCEARSVDAIGDLMDRKFISNKRFKYHKGVISRTKGNVTLTLTDSVRISRILTDEPCYETIPAEFI